MDALVVLPALPETRQAGRPAARPTARPAAHKIAAMDEATFEAFYDRTARPLWAYLYKVGGDPSLADDLLQEAFYRYVRSRFGGESDEHRRNYLYRIATNLLRDHFRERRKATFIEVDPPGVDEGTERQVAMSEDLGRLLAALKPRERQLLWLAHVEGWSHEEIGRALEVNPRSVRLMVFRARRKLATLLAREGLAPEVTR